jgi:hypothetical protein
MATSVSLRDRAVLDRSISAPHHEDAMKKLFGVAVDAEGNETV